MKNLHTFLLTALFFCLLLTACETVAYLGEKYPLNQNVKVYYAARDVKRDYKVIGHFSNTLNGDGENSKSEIIGKAKTVGADAVIFTGFGTTAGKDGNNTITADAIKYTDDTANEPAN